MGQTVTDRDDEDPLFFLGDRWRLNSYGVEVDAWDRGNVPRLCTTCRHLEVGDWVEYVGRSAEKYCAIGIFLPTRKGSCKRKSSAGVKIE